MFKKSDFMLNEKDSLQDLLNDEKQMVSLYGTALIEAEAKNVRTLFKTNLNETAEDQYLIFSTMQKNDYYQTKPANKTVIDEQAEKFKSVKSQLG